MIGRWVFRVASSPRWGAGHMSRCLTLATALRRTAPGIAIDFLLDDEGGQWTGRLQETGFGRLTAPPQLQEWGAIIDHPARADAAELRTTQGCSKLVYIDDDGRGLRGADLTVHPHPGDAVGVEGAEVLSGSAYAPVDPAWSLVGPPPLDRPVGRILIGLGQVDSVDATSRVLEAVLRLDHDLDRINVAVGESAPHRQAVQHLASRSAKCRIHVGADLRPLVSESDLAIGGGGVSLLERLAAGVPTISISQNRTQRLIIAALAEAGATVDGGDVSHFARDEFLHKLRLCFSPERRSLLSATGRLTIDGKGAERIAARIGRLDAKRVA